MRGLLEWWGWPWLEAAIMLYLWVRVVVTMTRRVNL